MSFTIPADGLSTLSDVLAPFAKAKRLDGTTIPTTLHVADDRLTVEVVPDLPRITSVTASVGPAVGEGTLTLSTERLTDMCRRASGDLTFEGADGAVVVGPWTTPQVEPRSRPVFDESAAMRVPRASFMEGLAFVKAAASTDLVRPRLTIVHFGKGFARACDGMRYQECRVDFQDEWDVSVFVAPLLNRYFETGHGEELVLYQTETHQGYGSGGLLVTVPRPMSEFLDLDELVAQPARAHNNFHLKVDRQALVNAVQDAAIMAGESSIVTLDVETQVLTVTASDGALNRAEVRLPCSWSGDARRMRFYITPFLHLLKTTSSEVLELRLGTSTLRQLTSAVVWEGGKFSLLNQVRVEG